MVATLVALVGAVVTVVFYVVTADRLDYATVQRRQLDLWVAVIGLGCLVTMLLGAAEVRREPTPPATLVPRAPHASPLVARLGTPDLRRSALLDLPATIDVSADALATQTPSASVDSPVAAVVREDVHRPYYVFRRVAELAAPTAVATTASVSSLAPVPSPVGGDTWHGVVSPSLHSLPIDTPVPRVEPALVAPAPLPTAQRDPTPEPIVPRLLPTLPPDPVSPLPTPTPNCGDPQRIQLSLTILDAYVDRSDDRIAVSYRAEVRNRSPFPVTLVDIAAVVESDDVSERYGQQSLSSVALEPEVLHRLDGRVELAKSPSPFDLTRLCVSFVPETCGRSVPYRITKHCLTTRGF